MEDKTLEGRIEQRKKEAEEGGIELKVIKITRYLGRCNAASLSGRNKFNSYIFSDQEFVMRSSIFMFLYFPHKSYSKNMEVDPYYGLGRSYWHRRYAKVQYRGRTVFEESFHADENSIFFDGCHVIDSYCPEKEWLEKLEHLYTLSVEVEGHEQQKKHRKLREETAQAEAELKERFGL